MNKRPRPWIQPLKAGCFPLWVLLIGSVFFFYSDSLAVTRAESDVFIGTGPHSFATYHLFRIVPPVGIGFYTKGDGMYGVDGASSKAIFEYKGDKIDGVFTEYGFFRRSWIRGIKGRTTPFHTIIGAYAQEIAGEATLTLPDSANNLTTTTGPIKVNFYYVVLGAGFQWVLDSGLTLGFDSLIINQKFAKTVSFVPDTKTGGSASDTAIQEDATGWGNFLINQSANQGVAIIIGYSF